MAFSEFELARINHVVGGFCERRVPLEVRDQVRMEYAIRRHDVEIVEVRPLWNDASKESRSPIAKLRYVRAADEWRLLWMRRDLRWHTYEPLPGGRTLEELVEEIDRDPHRCFFG